jgi:hypothetical protein
MKFLILPLLLFVVCAVTVNTQRKQPIKPTPQERARTEADLPEIKKLRDEYVVSTKEYKVSLQRLLALYQDGLSKAEEKNAQAQRLFADGLMTNRDVSQCELGVTNARSKVSEVEQQITTADRQIAAAVNELDKPERMESLVREYRLESARRASARQPNCRNWTLNASRQERGQTVIVAFKLLCKN